MDDVIGLCTEVDGKKTGICLPLFSYMLTSNILNFVYVQIHLNYLYNKQYLVYIYIPADYSKKIFAY